MATKEEINAIPGDFRVNINRFLAKDKETIVSDIVISNDLHKLLKEFSCTNLPNTEGRIYDMTFKRYSIKKVLRNSLNWNSYMDLLFSTDIIDDKKIRMTFNNISESTDLEIKMRDIVVQVTEKAYNLKCLDSGHETKMFIKTPSMS